MWEGRQSRVESPGSRESNKDNSASTEQWTIDKHNEKDADEESFAVKWFESRLNEVKAGVEHAYKDFRLSENLKTIYSLIWDDFCSWYLEWIKPGFEQPIDRNVYEKTIDFFEELMQLLHPFMPFVTEEVYHQLRDQKVDLTIRQSSPVKFPVEKILDEGRLLKEVISAIRDTRNRNKLKPKEAIRLYILTEDIPGYQAIETILAKQVNAEKISYTDETVANTITVVVQKDKFFIETSGIADQSFQKVQLEKDLEYLKGFLVSVEKKLSNERFVNNAKPEVLEIERKKKADAEEKIRLIKESLGEI
jgi:valyl-tRNA synthetase